MWGGNGRARLFHATGPDPVKLMKGLTAKIALAFAMPLLLVVRLITAEEGASADYPAGDNVPLDADDLQEITLQVLEKNPLLSSSPGIKFAAAQRSVRSTDIADIIFYPHVENAGIKQAFQVQCWRQDSSQPWTCNETEIRRYVQLDSQHFEVRVKGDIGFTEALALIQATRATVQASETDGSAIPDTAILILPQHYGYLVTWGSPEGYTELAVEARLTDGGNPAEPVDWQTSMPEPKDQ
jgi:hypothetical protein